MEYWKIVVRLPSSVRERIDELVDCDCFNVSLSYNQLFQLAINDFLDKIEKENNLTK